MQILILYPIVSPRAENIIGFSMVCSKEVGKAARDRDAPKNKVSELHVSIELMIPDKNNPIDNGLAFLLPNFHFYIFVTSYISAKQPE